MLTSFTPDEYRLARGALQGAILELAMYRDRLSVALGRALTEEDTLTILVMVLIIAAREPVTERVS